MKIGELASSTGVTTKTIRYYEQIGLLADPPRTQSGYRNYDPTATERLGFVKAAQRAGLALTEIRSVLDIHDRGDVPCGHVSALIDAKLHDIDERLQALQRTQQELRQLRNRAGSLNPKDCGAEPICQIIEPNHAIAPSDRR
jgi:MerR family copper efflux transcriptional regulator